MPHELAGRGNLRLPNGANWNGYYLINSGEHLQQGAYGLFTPNAPSEPIFNLAHGERSEAELTMADDRVIAVTIMFNGAGAVDMVSFASDPFSA